MARALEALAAANAEVLAFSSSSYRQSFCFLVRNDELRATMSMLEADLALELTHGYLKPIEVDQNVGSARSGRRGHARHARTGGPHLQRHLAPERQHHRHRARLQRNHHQHRRPPDGLERAIHAVHEVCT